MLPSGYSTGDPALGSWDDQVDSAAFSKDSVSAPQEELCCLGDGGGVGGGVSPDKQGELLPPPACAGPAGVSLPPRVHPQPHAQVAASR